MLKLKVYQQLIPKNLKKVKVISLILYQYKWIINFCSFFLKLRIQGPSFVKNKFSQEADLQFRSSKGFFFKNLIGTTEKFYFKDFFVSFL